MKILFIIFILVSTSYIYAAGFGLGLGGYALDTGTQKDAQGGSNATTIHPGINGKLIFNISGSNSFNPEFGYVFHRETADTYGTQSKKTIYILWDLSYAITKKLILQYGIGTFMTKISGDGGTVSVRNGESGTATAYKPEESVTSYNSTLNLGVEYFFFDKTSFKGEGFVFSFLSSEKRNIKYAISLHQYF